ncbi:MAG: hypothetical protein V5A47_10455 [Bacteroidales bacterium]|nr:hypothetical protein [Bacteroidales bacterium]MBS3776115.1 hypothetical protein [Bacteroidales bacterium]
MVPMQREGKWNTYEVVCVGGTIKLSVNGNLEMASANLHSRKATSSWNRKVQTSIFGISGSLNFLNRQTPV